MYIFAGSRQKIGWLARAPLNAKCQISEFSNINRDIFIQWFKWFVEMLPPARPQLLILDGHFAHISLEAVKYGQDNNVHTFVLPAHTSHFLQPLDVKVYQPFKALYDQGVKNYPLKHGGALPVKDDVGEISSIPFKLAFSDKNIQRGFRDTGIFPLSLEAMLSKMVGNKPAPSNVRLRYHSMMVPHFNDQPVDARTEAALKRRKLDLDTLNVVNLSLKMILAPQSQKRPKEDFVDEKVSGGKLLSYEEMLQEKLAKDAEKATKDAAKEAAKLPGLQLKSLRKDERSSQRRRKTCKDCRKTLKST